MSHPYQGGLEKCICNGEVQYQPETFLALAAWIQGESNQVGRKQLIFQMSLAAQDSDEYNQPTEHLPIWPLSYMSGK
jgi:hypothetical protein